MGFFDGVDAPPDGINKALRTLLMDTYELVQTKANAQVIELLRTPA